MTYGTDIGLEPNVLHFWLLDQGDVWIDGNGQVHFIDELDVDHLFALLDYLWRLRGRLEFGLGIWRGIVQALARTHRPVQWAPTRLQQSMLWHALHDELGRRFGHQRLDTSFHDRRLQRRLQEDPEFREEFERHSGDVFHHEDGSTR